LSKNISGIIDSEMFVIIVGNRNSSRTDADTNHLTSLVFVVIMSVFLLHFRFIVAQL